MALNETPVEISSSEFMEGGGLYPGGTGIITDIAYVLWDYNGSQPKDSVFAVRCVTQPNDGSNDNKPVESFWAAGKATEFTPNLHGTKPMALQPSTAPQLRSNTNWNFVFNKFKDNCGLVGSQLEGPNGIKILIGSEVTLSRMDQPHREGLDNAPPLPGQPEKKKFKPTILAPTRCKFAWERGGASTAFATPVPTQQPQYAMPPQQPAPQNPAVINGGYVPQAQPNGNNGGGDIDSLIVKGINGALIQSNGRVDFAQLAALANPHLTAAGVTVEGRLAIIPMLKDPNRIAALATANGWTFNGQQLSI